MSGESMRRRIWFDRRFELGVPLDAFVDIVERLRGTPTRLEERTAGLSDATLTDRVGGHWSIQEHAGHLGDLEVLWLGRLDDIAEGLSTLRSADLDNRATWEADHNSRSLADVLARFRDLRRQLIARLAAMDNQEIRATALHPRLMQPMTVVDLCFFIAEHDDHHLAAITRLRDAV
jgi:uncharacterized damage-inducible protein DinB